MRRLLIGLALFLVVCGVSVPTFADSIQYNVTGTFSGDVSSAPLSGPNGAYTISFSLARNPTPDFVDVADFAIANVPILYSFQCNGCGSAATFSGLALDVDFAGPSLGGLFVLEFLAGGHDYFFNFQGATIFSGPTDAPTLLTGGPFAATGQFGLDNNEFVDLGTASVTAIPQAETPEPSTLALLVAALAAVGVTTVLRARNA
jgi:hypothetical protein